VKPCVREFVELVRNSIPLQGPIYEIGSYQVPGQEELADLRPLFSGLEYFGTDMRMGPGVDLILNLHNIELPDNSVPTILCLETLEHTEYPYRAIEEIHRVLMPEGITVISSLMDFPIHDHPYDYWRYTPEAFRSILKPFQHSWIGFAGKEYQPHTVVGIGFKGSHPPLHQLEERYQAWQRKQNHLSLIEYVRRLLTPPILSPRYRKALGLTKRVK